jgi:hypothetical protein
LQAAQHAPLPVAGQHHRQRGEREQGGRERHHDRHVDVEERGAAVGRARLVEERNAADDDHQQQWEPHAEDEPEALAREQLQLGEGEPPEGRTPFGGGQRCDGNGHVRVSPRY